MAQAQATARTPNKVLVLNRLMFFIIDLLFRLSIAQNG